MKSQSEAYKKAGVDINAGYRAVELMKRSIARTVIPGADCDLGGFGGLFVPDLSGMKEPVLVSGTDGVGTKLKLAFVMDCHDTIGIDCVAMCVNDVLCCGAKPLFFLDYLALGKNKPERVADIVAGMAEGCVQAGCALIGGETAEMPGFYSEEEYDIAGFCVGIVDREKIIRKETAEEGDVLIGLPSSGVHSNGFSLVRHLIEMDRETLLQKPKELNGKTLGEALLAPTVIYVKPMLKLMESVRPKGIAHITGGGFFENIPRALPKGLCAHIDRGAWEVPYLFRLLQERGSISDTEMFSTFNMGVGMCVVVKKEDARRSIDILKENGVSAFVLGMLKAGDEGVRL